MKKLQFKLKGKEMLTKEQMKKISGGNTNVCHLPGESGYNCDKVCFRTWYGGTYRWGTTNCNELHNLGDPEYCDNYCCEPLNGVAFWCNSDMN